MNVQQLDMFVSEQKEPARSIVTQEPVLNGMYYERVTGKFVGYSQGKRMKAIPAKYCGWPKDWQEKTKRERSI